MAVALASATKMYRANEDGRALPVLLLAPIVASGALPAHLVCLTPFLHSVLWGLVFRIALPLWLSPHPVYGVMDEVTHTHPLEGPCIFCSRYTGMCHDASLAMSCTVS